MTTMANGHSAANSKVTRYNSAGTGKMLEANGVIDRIKNAMIQAAADQRIVRPYRVVFAQKTANQSIFDLICRKARGRGQYR